jgi:hypothetical protein
VDLGQQLGVERRQAADRQRERDDQQEEHHLRRGERAREQRAVALGEPVEAALNPGRRPAVEQARDAADEERTGGADGGHEREQQAARELGGELDRQPEERAQREQRRDQEAQAAPRAGERRPVAAQGIPGRDPKAGAGSGGRARHARSAARGQHRDEEERHRQRGDERDHDREREVAEGLPGHSLDEDHGQEDGDRGERRSDHRGAHLVGAAHHRVDQLVALLAAAVDRLEHHDRAVDEHADAERQPPSDMMLSERRAD